jgi:hypothetical protein
MNQQNAGGQISDGGRLSGGAIVSIIGVAAGHIHDPEHRADQISFPGMPLHDGAVVVRFLIDATTVLPQ